MIAIASEDVLPLVQAADELPRRRRGRKTYVSTLYRRATVGCRGVVLETIQVGGTRCTSREALQRFVERLSAARDAGPRTTPHSPRSAARRQRDSEKAAAELEALGA